jgi:cold-inducible RNA-binding protein
MKIYVGNLSYSTSEADIRTSFGQYGTVDSADVIVDRDSGRSKGFGFVEMSNDAEAKAAIEGLNGKEVDGRNMNVNEARPRPDRQQRSSRY